MEEDVRARWDARHEERSPEFRVPSPFLLSLDGLLPRRGRAIDVAGGAGRHAIWLARRGLEVLLVDFSEVGIRLARERAGEAGVGIETLVADLERDPLPRGPFDLVLSFHYLQRSLFSVFPEILVEGGLLVYAQATRSNLQRHARPSERYVLDDGELPSLVRGLEILRYEEGWLDEGRHEARMIARKPPGRVAHP